MNNSYSSAPWRFLKEEEGAVTVDWVVLTAAVVGLVVAIYPTLETNTVNLADAAATAVEAENDGFLKP